MSLALAALLTAGFAACGSASDSEYLTCVTSALEALEKGQNDAALAQLKVALRWDAADPLAHTALGVSLLMGTRPKEAAAEFAESLVLDPRCSEALFGQALVKLSAGSTADATELLCKAQTLGSKPEIEETIQYLKSLAGAVSQTNTFSTSDAGRAMSALDMMGRKQYVESLAVWKELQPADAAPAFRERNGFSMTFLPGKPVVVAGTPIKGKLDLPTAATPKGPRLSGTVSLRADLTKVRDVSMVAFLVDSKLVGLTNEPPFQYMWDTTRAANGKHTVKIVGSDSGGCAISEKTTVVQVTNQVARASNQNDGDGQAQAWNRLWSLMRLKASPAAVNYNLAVCARETGDLETAEAALERVLAVDPNYRDASHMLCSLIAQSGRSAQSLHRVRTSAKVMALTFDDGPGPDTAKLLDLLRDNDVKATFFIVGKQVEAYGDLLRRMVQEGHEIENHTYNHCALDYLTTAQIQQEIFRGATAIRSATGKGTPLLRPPGGRSGKGLEDVAKKFGLGTVFWTANCTSLQGGNWQKMRDYIVASASPGAIVLMHNAEGVTMQALPAAIDALRAQGYTFATLSEMVAESSQARK